MYLEQQLAIRIDLTVYAKACTIFRCFCFIKNSMHQCALMPKDQLETDPKTVDENYPPSHIYAQSHWTPCKFVV